MKKYLPVFRILAIVFAVILAWALRVHAVETLSTDYDEDDYMRAGQEYAAFIRSGNWAGFTQTNYRPEHPPLAKIAYGIVYLFQPEHPLVADVAITDPPAKFLPPDLRQSGRTLAAALGTLEVLLLALVNPLGGLFLAIHTWTIKYTSQVMLDALPSMLGMATILAYIQYKRSQQSKWLIFSAILLGLTADSKFLHSAVGFAILADWFWQSRENGEIKKFFSRAIPWGLLAIAAFFAANPYLWADPLGKLQATISAISYTATNTNVSSANFPFWQQFVWLNSSVPWQPEAFYIRIDPLILILAFAGLQRLWKKETVFVFWFGVATFLLLIWTTKWPQYTLVLTAPLSIAAAEGTFALVVDPIRNWYKNRALPKLPGRNELGQALPWLIPGLLAFVVFTIIPLLFQFAVSMTDFNVASIRDAFQHGGIWRAVWGGLTGQVPITPLNLDVRSNQVNFTGLGSYPPVFSYLSQNGILVFNFLWTVFSVALQTMLGLGVALLLWQRGVRFGKFWQALFIIPWAIPEMIGALMWFNIFLPDNGWLALAAQTYGPNIPFGFFIGWENSANLWLLVFLIPAMWYGFPFMMLAASAGLKMLPEDVYDAAAIDGANAWQAFRHVTWPLLMPLLVPAIIVRSIFAFNQFYLFQAFYFTDSTLTTLSYNVFNPSGFNATSGQFAISAVINILNVLVLIGLVAVFNRWSKAGEGVTYA